MLHKLNPVRLAYVRDMIDQHFGLDECSFRPLAAKRALDVGCGAGLLAEPLARLGAQVTAVDAAPEVIEVAKAHAEGQGLSLDYRADGWRMGGAVRPRPRGGYSNMSPNPPHSPPHGGEALARAC